MNLLILLKRHEIMKQQSFNRLWQYAIATFLFATLAFISLVEMRLSKPRLLLAGGFDISKVYAEDVASGEKVIESMQGHINSPLLVKMLNDPSMRSAFAAAIGSDLDSSPGEHSGSLTASAFEKLGLAVENSNNPSKEKLNALPHSSSDSGQAPKLGKVIKATPQAKLVKAVPVKVHRASPPVAYEAFAPGLISGSPTPVHVQAGRHGPHSEATVASVPVPLEAVAIGVSASAASADLRHEVQRLEASEEQLHKHLSKLTTALKIAPPMTPAVPHGCDVATHQPKTQLAAKPYPAVPVTFAQVLAEAHRLRMGFKVSTIAPHHPAQSHPAQALLRATACHSAGGTQLTAAAAAASASASATTAASAIVLPRAVAPLPASGPPRQVSLACALPLLADALGGIDCSDEAPAASAAVLDPRSRGQSILRALDSVGLGDDAVRMGSRRLGGATVASLSPVEAARERRASAALGYSTPGQLARHRLLARLAEDEAALRRYRQHEAAARGFVRPHHARDRGDGSWRRGPPPADLMGLRGPEGAPAAAAARGGLGGELHEAAEGDVANAGDRLVPVA